jgi:hypothetical protein
MRIARRKGIAAGKGIAPGTRRKGIGPGKGNGPGTPGKGNGPGTPGKGIAHRNGITYRRFPRHTQHPIIP